MPTGHLSVALPSFNPCFVGLWGFEFAGNPFWYQQDRVSILVLLDYGALSIGWISEDIGFSFVSILVLLDYGALSRRKSLSNYVISRSFNPCFVGLWGFEMAEILAGLPKL